MAKPTPLPPLDAEQRVSAVAPVILSLRVADVRRYELAVETTGDEEAIHDMRVASRRLRAALDFFELPKKLSRRVKRLQDALGGVRDRQVQAAALLRDARRREPALRQALRAAAKALEEDVGPQRRVLEKELRRWRDRTAPQIEKAMEAVDSKRRLGGRHYQRELPSRRRALGRQLKAFRKDDDPEVAHRLRIATKKLRYDAELLESLQAEAAALLRLLVPLQESLGDLHDLDVRVELLVNHLRGRALQRVLELLQRERVRLVRRARTAAQGLVGEEKAEG